VSTESYSLFVQDLEFEVNKKDIKNLHINILPPEGKVRISAPLEMTEESIRLAIVTRITRIKKEIAEMQSYVRESQREMISGESHYMDGNRYLLEVVEKQEKPVVSISRKKILQLQVRPNSTREKREEVLNEWHRDRLRKRLESLTEKWEKAMRQSAEFYGIKRMHTKWGTCHSTSRRIWLNLELGKKHPDCLEYVLVHELVHLIEPTHSDRFFELMDKHMPNWAQYKALLDEPPIMHVDWDY
jgi:predicted metal-dependent hydrolase